MVQTCLVLRHKNPTFAKDAILNKAKQPKMLRETNHWPIHVILNI